MQNLINQTFKAEVILNHRLNPLLNYLFSITLCMI